MKNLLNFLEKLQEVTQANIDFLKHDKKFLFKFEEYEDELLQVQDLINTFDFVGKK